MRVTIEYSLFMRHFLATHPEWLRAARRLVQEGRLEVCPTLAGCMEQALGGEALVRQIVLGKRWAARVLGAHCLTAHHTDLPGHAAQLPQLLAKAGIRYLAYSRFAPPQRLHFWRAPDGSRVLAASDGLHYNWGFVLRRERWREDLAEDLAHLERHWPPGVPEVLMCSQDDLHEVDPGEPDRAEAATAAGFPTRVAVLTDFFKAASRRARNIPTYEGESPYGFYAIPAFLPETYREARGAEGALLLAEKAGFLREALGLGRADWSGLERLWEELSFPHDHNIGGRHGEVNDEVRTQRARYARVAAQEAAREAATAMAPRVRYRREGVPLVVFNPLSWERDEVLSTYMTFPGEGWRGACVVDERGRPLPVRVEGAEDATSGGRADAAGWAASCVRFSFLARGLPPVGYRTFYVVPRKRPPAAGEVYLRRGGLRVGEWEVRLGREGVDEVRWRGRRLFGPGLGNLIVHENARWDLEDALDERWSIDRPNFTGRRWVGRLGPVRLLDATPLAVRLAWGGRVAGGRWQTVLSLSRDLPWAEMEILLDWRGKRLTTVCAQIPFRRRARLTYESPFWAVEPGGEMPGAYCGAGRTVGSWVDLSVPGLGVTLAGNCGVWLVRPPGPAPVVLRTAYSSGTPFYWYDNVGRHRLRFRMLPHEGDWRAARSWRAGWELASPPLLFQFGTNPPLAPLAEEATLPERLAGISVSSPDVVVTAAKRAFDGRGHIVRLLNVSDRPRTATLRFAVRLRSARLAALDEQPGKRLHSSGDGLRVRLRGGEVVTLLVELEEGRLGGRG